MADPRILWARSLNGVIVVHGRDLTNVNVNLSKPQAKLDGVSLNHLPDVTADGPGAYQECQLFVDAGGSQLSLTREDGKTSTATVQRFKYQDAQSPLTLSGPIKLKSGSYSGLDIEVNTDGPVVEIDGVGVSLRDCTIINKGDGPGIQITNATDCLFDDIYIKAEEPIYSPPQHVSLRNSFCGVELVGSHPQKGQAANRGMLGEQNLIGECVWRDIDRGIVAQQSGPAMLQNLVYRCVQRNTGTTIGGSEGILFEAYNGLPVDAAIAGTVLKFTTPQKQDARTGLFACDMATQRIARIVQSSVVAGSTGLNYSITLDRDMGTSSGKWFIGNVAVDNTIVHQTGISGKLLLHLFGRSSGTVCRFWDARQIHDVVVEEACPIQLDRKMTGFAWSNVYDRIRTTGETRGIYRCQKYYDGNLSTESQLPWNKYAQ